ncbi:MAG: tetratricopeptide repeat protein, partial [Myxococcales bacterium]|nr:tetratricopeptide repeat protein [Myxococcales bacterium]
RVADFGLARAVTRRTDAPEGDAPARVEAAGNDERYSERWELTGASTVTTVTPQHGIVGTPAYMAPEAFTGADVDARADQFSFCASLFEAIHGRLPFAGKSIPELLANVEAGALTTADDDADVPAWLRGVMIRGLATDPAARYPSMQALTAELERGRGLVRRRLLTSLAALVVALLIGVVVLAVDEDAPPCGDVEAPIEQAWSAERRAAVAGVFAASKAPYAGETGAYVLRAADALRDDWIAQRRDACEATRVQEIQSEAIMDLRVACLERVRYELAAFVELLEVGDPRTVENAAAAIAAVKSPERCGEIDRLMAHARVVDDPALAAEVARLEQGLARVWAAHYAGAVATSSAALDELLPAIEATSFGPLRAEALRARANIRLGRGEYRDAQADLEEAYFTALASGEDEEALGSAHLLAYALAVGRVDTDAAMGWLRHARALLERRSSPTREVAAVSYTEGVVLEISGQSAQAVERFEQALAQFERLPERDPLVEQRLHNALAISLDALARFDEARSHYRHAIAVIEEVRGREHPELIDVVGNLGLNLVDSGRHVEAIPQLERARDLARATYGADGNATAIARLNLGAALEVAGDEARAADEFAAALAILEVTQGPDHLDVALCLTNLGLIRESQGQLEEALSLQRRALAIARANYDAGHVELALYLGNTASALLSSGLAEEALPLAREAVDLDDAHAGAPRLKSAELRDNLGRALLELGQPVAAIEPLERADAMLGEVSGPPRMHYMVRSDLARALWESGRGRGRAVELLEQLAARHELTVADRGRLERWQRTLDEAL